MKFCSFFSGIEAASVAFKPLGWDALSFSEIEPFPCAVLKHHYPEVPNHGDITKFDWSVYAGKADIVCGGPPCQAFSIAGLRRSLDDDRGNLSLAFARAIRAIRPKWVLLENVPGMLNTKDNAFGCILAGLSGADVPLAPGTNDGRWRGSGIVSGHKEAYGLAWRVLNAEHFGVPQRRRRVFVVGYLGDWRPAAEVLFEPQGLRRDSGEGGEAGQGAAGGVEGGVGTDGGTILIDRAAFNQGENALYEPHIEQTEVCDTVISRGPHAVLPPAGGTRANGGGIGCDPFNGTITGTITSNSGGTTAKGPKVIQPLVLEDQGGSVINVRTDGKVGTLRSQSKGQEPSVIQPVAFKIRQGCEGGGSRVFCETGPGWISEGVGCLRAEGENRPSRPTHTVMAHGQGGAEVLKGKCPTLNCNHEAPIVGQSAVRRLTPTECERLQGFPDGHTAIPWKKKPASECPDGPRYKALGNSWAVPCAAWIGRRIQAVEDSMKIIQEDL